MKITLKLVLVVSIATVLVLSLTGYFRVQREITAFETDMNTDLRMLGQLLQPMLADSLRTYGQQHVRELIADANKNHEHLRFCWLDLVTLASDHHHLKLPRAQIASLQHGTSIAVKARTERKHGVLYVYVPISTGNTTPHVLEIAKDLSAVRDYVHDTILRTVVVGLMLALLSGCLLLLIGMVIIAKPMRRVIDKTRRVGMGDLKGPLIFRQRDEFAEVATALNHMCEQLTASHQAVRAEMESRLATLEQLRHADRLKTVGSLASGIAHELGTPLNVISGRSSLIASGQITPADIAKSTHVINEQVQRMTTIIRQLLNFVRRKSPQRVATDLRSLARHTLNLLAPLAAQQCAELTLQTDDAPVRACVDTEQFQQVLINLVANAWQAMPHGGQIVIGLHGQMRQPPPVLELASGHYACLSVSDQGEGIDADDLRHIFDPFFTTKAVGRGTGRGLSIAYGIVRDHGGWIDVDSRPNGGACFTVYVPLEETLCPDAS